MIANYESKLNVHETKNIRAIVTILIWLKKYVTIATTNLRLIISTIVF